jgi:hypothetical protein
VDIDPLISGVKSFITTEAELDFIGEKLHKVLHQMGDVIAKFPTK